MIFNTIVLIGSTCFLMLHKPNSNDYFIGFIFNMGIYAFFRLVILSCAGNIVTNSYREMVRNIYETMPQWNAVGWINFFEIKSLHSQFEVKIGGTYTVKQSTIISVLGFTLNYIVILLQTENYSNSHHHSNQTKLNVKNYSVGSIVVDGEQE